MRFPIFIASMCLCWSVTAHAQYHSMHYGYSAVIANGAGSLYVIEYPYPYARTWPYYLDTGTGPLGPFVGPPLYVPPEQLGFGPQALWQFRAPGHIQPPTVNYNIVIAPPARDAIEADNREPRDDAKEGDALLKPRVRESNAEARGRARRLVELGNAQFAARNLAGAYDRYRKAAGAAPDLAEVHFRQGQTLADMSRYEQAAAEFRRGLSLRPNWPDSGFRLAEMYGDNQAAQASAVHKAERAAAARPDDVNAQFVAGVQFFFDGQADRARMHFERAQALGEAAEYVEPFLKSLVRLDEAELDI